MVEAAAGTRQLAPGTMLDDKYRIESLLAVGGMGAVYVGIFDGGIDDVRVFSGALPCEP